jgi:hypothetical protein
MNDNDATRTIWMAYYHDFSGMGLFATEIEALRYAVNHSMTVVKITLPCQDIKESVRNARPYSEQAAK